LILLNLLLIFQDERLVMKNGQANLALPKNINPLLTRRAVHRIIRIRFVPLRITVFTPFLATTWASRAVCDRADELADPIWFRH
jgi:hypothetical protein